MTPNATYSAYLFHHLYVLPTGGRSRAWRGEILRQQLGLPPGAATYVRGDRFRRLLSAAGRVELAGWLEWLDDAQQQGHRRVLVLRDDALLPLDFASRLEQQTTGRRAREWQLLEFDAGWGFGREAIASLYRELACLDSSSVAGVFATEILQRLAQTLPHIYRPGLAVDPKTLEGQGKGSWQPFRRDFDPRRRTITACCVSRRPECIANALENFARQSYDDKQLVLVLNGEFLAASEAQALAERRGIANPVILQTAASVSLGECLQLGLEASAGTYWCKMDDDDFYAEDYLLEAFEHLVGLPGDLVGKALFQVFFPRQHRGYSSTDKEYCHVDFERHHGATIFGRRSLIRQIGFPALDLGEDQGFYRRAAQRGDRLISSSRENFIYIRHCDNTSDFESHLSKPWKLLDSALYGQLVEARPTLDDADLASVKPEDFAAWFRRSWMARRASGHAAAEVPRVIHQIWIGPRPRPEHWLETWSHRYRQRFPDWRYKLWTEAEISGLEVCRHPVYDKLSWAGKADLLRYEILHRHGGIYIDADSSYINGGSLDDVVSRIDDVGLLVAEEPFYEGEPTFFAIGVMAAVPKNPLLAYFRHRACELTRRAVARGEPFEAWQVTGPVMATEVLQEMGLANALPSHLFFPEYWNQRQLWDLSREELEERYPNSLMFQYGYSTVEKVG